MGQLKYGSLIKEGGKVLWEGDWGHIEWLDWKQPVWGCVRAEENWLSWQHDKTCGDSGLQISSFPSSSSGPKRGNTARGHEWHKDGDGHGWWGIQECPLWPGRRGWLESQLSKESIQGVTHLWGSPLAPCLRLLLLLEKEELWDSFPYKTSCRAPVVDKFPKKKTEKGQLESNDEEVSQAPGSSKLWCNRTLSPDPGSLLRG